MPRRLDELDALLGIALGMMLVSNFVSDLDFFDIMDVAEGSGWWWFSRLTAGLFVAVAGVAAFLASHKEDTPQVLHRSLRLAGYAYAITLVTWLAIPQAFVRFGVLHLLALAGLVALLMRKRAWLARGRLARQLRELGIASDLHPDAELRRELVRLACHEISCVEELPSLLQKLRP